MSVLPELERQLMRAAGGARGGPRPLRGRLPRSTRGWGALALGSAIVAVVVLAFVTIGARRAHPSAAAHRASVGRSTPRPHAPAVAEPVVPATYQQACQQTSDCANVPLGLVPSALDRPFRVPALRPGEACPATPGVRFTNSYIGGVELGRGPVRPDIGNQVDVPHGRIVLGTTNVRGWFGIKTVWYSVPSYDGPWSVRAVRLSGSGRIDLENQPTPSFGRVGGGSPFSPIALVIPPGPTINTSAGYRTDPRSTWITAPGCYAWVVDGLNFSEVIVFQALPPPIL